MVVRHKVEGYENFIDFISTLNSKNEAVYILFCGSDLDSQPGVSWCDDCQRAEPVVEKALATSAPQNSHFITVKVGTREFWKNMSNPFRKDPNLHLMVVPTIIQWQTPKRLEGEQCEKLEVLELLFDDSFDI